MYVSPPLFEKYSLGLPPTDASHRQDYYIFNRESDKPSFATVTGWGVDPKYSFQRESFLIDLDHDFYAIFW